MRWFRMYNELIDDPKVDKMSDKTFKFFVFTMCLASEEDQEGYINLTERDISWRLRMRSKTIKTSIKELIDLKIIANNNGHLQLINWNKRQFKSDDVNVRVKRYRKRYNETLHETAPEQNRTDTEQMSLVNLLFDLIKERRPSFKLSTLANWTKPIDLMIRLDKRDPEEIEKVIKWCQQDEFWQNNILSTSKLRKQYDQLCLKMEATDAKPKRFDEEDF